ncbi:MAG TPA: hypothetical protein VMM36_15085 [Opitutaceae bacterium]|nr:hypothetical protein [Opitutaceae bacterium]
MNKSALGTILVTLIFVTDLPAAANPVYVSNVEELYSAVNDPSNAGATIKLAAGTYMLSPTDPFGSPRPKGGRLELQQDMSIVGVVGDRSSVVINAFNLPATSYLGVGPSAALRTGNGTNSVEWLTVRDARFGQANIDTGLQAPGTAYIRIAHVAATGSARGLNVLNFGPAASGETIEIDIIDNDFYQNLIGLSEGMRIGNFQGATGATVNAWVEENRSWGNKQGLLVVNNRAINSTVNVQSSGNRFVGNGAGTIIVGGLSSNNTTANGNTINFEGYGDRFVDNNGDADLDVGGLVVVGGENISIPNGTNDNTVNVSLWGCRMAENNVFDLLGIGARSAPSSLGSPGVNNQVTIIVSGEGSNKGRWQPVEFFTETIPFAASGTNTVTVIR